MESLPRNPEFMIIILKTFTQDNIKLYFVMIYHNWKVNEFKYLLHLKLICTMSYLTYMHNELSTCTNSHFSAIAFLCASRLSICFC